MNEIKNASLVEAIRRLEKDGEISIYDAKAYEQSVAEGDVTSLRADVKERVALENITRNYSFRAIGRLLGVC